MKLRVVATAVGAAAVTLLAGSPAVAQAAALKPYDHKDPYRSGCGNSARAVRTAPINSRANGRVGTIKLMWSGKCKTNWTEITTATSASGMISVYRNGASDTFHFKKGNGGRHWGNMLYANNVCAWGSATVQWNGGRGGQNGSGSTGKACG
ncbi:YjfA family protein [Actinomadura sp. ATCC 31491]|uniref:YjfA family protein n=1 Tax=Actinomadura luzonensis TaxID=2805427 RepID=A0ABT0G972_9ACTN|nr:DUF2690 domain-containing protein [Actinomadura luzonensis]MCK2221136.1 YjfA family protein [Actinomadura luzonensis]